MKLRNSDYNENINGTDSNMEHFKENKRTV